MHEYLANRLICELLKWGKSSHLFCLAICEKWVRIHAFVKLNFFCKSYSNNKMNITIEFYT